MAIEKSFVPSEIPGVLRPEFRVDGDSWLNAYPTEEAAQGREAELATKADES